MVHRREDDNLTNFTVKVSSLQTLDYATVMRQNEVENEVEDDDKFQWLRLVTLSNTQLS
ncbi:hypothetical protein DY000_02020357 [Brassica cretica]|uniref:Uncharacterized protein n=1 Tax=Brassica cretica TaxID=69181 RepID=A0ABQ7EF68_BRACR|nr:hypothetical protein DY000_02020357 [Brassica cretica]